MERPSFVFHKEWLNQLVELPEDAQKHYALAIVKYALEGKEPEYSNPFEKVWFSSIKNRIDADGEKYKERCERNRVNGSKSKGNPNFEKGKTNPYISKEITHSVTNDNPLGYQDNPVAKKDNPEAYDIDIDSDSDSDSDIDIDSDSEQKQTNKNNNKEIPSLSQIQEYIKTHCYASDPNSFYELNKKYNWAKVRKGEATWQELLDKFESNLPEEEREKAERKRKRREKTLKEYNNTLICIRNKGLEDIISISQEDFIRYSESTGGLSEQLQDAIRCLDVIKSMNFRKQYRLTSIGDRRFVDRLYEVKHSFSMLNEELKGRGIYQDVCRFIGTEERLFTFINGILDDYHSDVSKMGAIFSIMAKDHNLSEMNDETFRTCYLQYAKEYWDGIRDGKILYVSIISIMNLIKENEELSEYVPDYETAKNTLDYLQELFNNHPEKFKSYSVWRRYAIDFIKG